MRLTWKEIKWNKCEIYKNSCKWVHRRDVCYDPSLSRQKAEIQKQILKKKKHGGDGKRWPLTPFPPCALALPPPSHRDATTPSPCYAPHSMTQGASCSRIAPQASRASLPPRRWATTYCRLSLHPCTAPLSRSLQPLLRFSILSLGLSLLQFVSIVSPLLIHGNPILEPMCVFYLFLFCFCCSDRNELQL